MSALAMILTAAMIVPGDGPERASGEVEQRLDIYGEWEGTGQNAFSKLKARIKYSRGIVEVQGQNGSIGIALNVIDEGQGKLRMEVTVLGTVRRSLGIYKWQGNRLFICCREESLGRPTGFTVEGENCLLILHSVKSGK